MSSPISRPGQFVHYHTYDVFTDTRFGGNPLGVVLDARGLTDEQMLAVTREFNYPETTFLLPPSDPAYAMHVRIFTPGFEVPFAGHPTVGTAVALCLSGLATFAPDGETRLILEEKVGPVPVTVRAVEGVPTWAQLSVAKLPEEEAPMDRAQVARVLGLSPSDFLDSESHQPAVTSCGLPFLIVPLASRAAVARAEVDMAVHRAQFGGTSADFIMVFAHDASSGADLHARVFCPGANVPEDPATGSANAALAGYLAKRTPRNGTLRWSTAQGVEMERPSRLELEADKVDGTITAVRVGGSVVWISEGRMRVA